MKIPSMRDPTRLNTALYKTALQEFDVEGIEIDGGDGRVVVARADDLGEAVRSLVVALTIAYVEMNRWRGCSGYFDDAGTLRHHEGDTCPLHG